MASRATRAANALGVSSVSCCAALSIAAESLIDPWSRSGVPSRGAPLGAPDRDEFDFARLGRAVGLLARPPRQLLLAHRHPRAIHPEVQRRRQQLGDGRRLHDVLLVRGNLASQRLGRAFDVRGRYVDAAERVQQLRSFLEADHRAHPPHHAQHARRERRVDQTQRPIARAAPGGAGGAVVVRARQGQRAQHTREGLGAPPRIARGLAARARQARPDLVRRVGVEPRLALSSLC